MFRLFRLCWYDGVVPVAAAPLARQVEERARREPAFAEVVDAILDAPTAPHGTLERVAAAKLNDQRRVTLVQEFVDGAVPTPKAQALLRLKTPQAVHRLRTRGRLIGVAVGNQTWFPAWQFDGDRLHPDLPRILDLLQSFSSDPLAADRIMRLTHESLGGRSIAESLSRPRSAETAWRMLADL